MRRVRLIITAAAVSMFAACDTAPRGATYPSIVTPSNESAVVTDPIVSPLLEGFDAIPESGGGDDGDCSRWITRVDGRQVCIDALIAILLEEHPEDNDGDGIPNIGDEDIDGDGIPNGYDLDVDGDGVPNSYDDDIDGDGVTNDVDVDIDGDFIRNRWDPDIDGDLIFNPHDGDADGDGKFKYASLPGGDDPECGPATIFRDTDECDLDECDESAGAGSAGKEADCDDKGATSGSGDDKGQNKKPGEVLLVEDPEEPTATELEKTGQAAMELTDREEDPVDELSEADPDAPKSVVLDLTVKAIEVVLEDDEEDGTGSLTESLDDAGKQAFESRQRSTRLLVESAGTDLRTSGDMTDLISVAEKKLEASHDEFTDTIIEVDRHLSGMDIREDGAIAARFQEIADEAGLPSGSVASAVGFTASTARRIGEVEHTEPVFQAIAGRTAEHRSGQGGALFALPVVAQAANRIMLELDDLTVESLDESLDAVLDATEEFGVASPLQVVEKIIEITETDPTVSLADGISEAEADRGAMAAIN